MSEARPFSKEQQLARGERRYRREVASPKQWQAIFAAKRGPCRVCGAHDIERRVFEWHHLVSRQSGGDDVADNIVPLHQMCHIRVTERKPVALAALAASLTDAETAYVQAKLGPGGMERLFGVHP